MKKKKEEEEEEVEDKKKKKFVNKEKDLRCISTDFHRIQLHFTEPTPIKRTVTD
jgi:hypothetical protein